MIPVGAFVRWVRHDYESPLDLTLWRRRFKDATGEVVRTHHDGRLEIFWRWRNGESSISLHTESTVDRLSTLEVTAEAADS